MSDHYISLIIAYATGITLWFIINYLISSLWQDGHKIKFKKPWLEFIYAIIAVIVILAIGQLYLNDLLIPNNGNNKIIDALNQLLIFSPSLLLLVIRNQSSETIWLPKSKILYRLGMGIVISLSSLLAYWMTREQAPSLWSQLSNTFHPKNISHLVQVFMEDITIALIFVRLSAWIGNKKTIAIVACLFAAGHIPSLITSGFVLSEFASLLIDACIGVLVLSALSKSKDIWWFFILHFVLDMSQYYGG